VCITTNGTVKKDDRAVMGRGNAKQATIMVPEIERYLGEYLNLNGNNAGYLKLEKLNEQVVIFPVKHNWWEKADRKLIAKSRDWLWTEATNHPQRTFHLPRPGCGNGKLDWDRDVKKLVSDLPDNVWVHHIYEAAKAKT
jgi:hypothetical protein